MTEEFLDIFVRDTERAIFAGRDAPGDLTAESRESPFKVPDSRFTGVTPYKRLVSGF